MIVLGGCFFILFVKGVRSGQFDDLETPAHKVLLDDMPTEDEKSKDM